MTDPTIVLRCTHCPRETTAVRLADDPTEAVRIEIICPTCDDGDRHSPRYFAADGRELLFGRDFGLDAQKEGAEA